MPTDGSRDAADLRAALRAALRACRDYRHRHPPECGCNWCRQNGWVRSEARWAAESLRRSVGALGPGHDPD
jgi:hypothetical protein